MDLPIDGGGELGGWYAGIPGWRSWYTKERILDADDIDISDLKAEWGTESIPDNPPPILDELPMPQRAIEELGQLLVRHVRDVAIRSCDEQLLPTSNTPVAQRWRRIAAKQGGTIPPKVLIPDCVDEAIATFLRAIDPRPATSVVCRGKRQRHRLGPRRTRTTVQSVSRQERMAREILERAGGISLPALEQPNQ